MAAYARSEDLIRIGAYQKGSDPILDGAVENLVALNGFLQQDPNTLKVETDAGEQIRLLHFGKGTPAGGAATWQGDSVATWERGSGGPVMPVAGNAPRYGDLKVITKHIRPGYLRKNGVPYSANTTLTEYWDLNKERNGEQWIEVTTLVDDPTYLQVEWATSLHFKKEPDGSMFVPKPCSAR